MEKKGFTFIEMVVVIGVLVLALPALFSIVFTILQQQSKILRLSEVKRQGDYVVDNISATLRSNAVKIYSAYSSGFLDANEKCNTAGSSYTSSTSGQDFYFRDKSDNYIRYYQNSSTPPAMVADTNGSYPNGALTTDDVRIESFSISCSRSAQYSAPIVTISFTICYGTSTCTSGRTEETASLTYQTNIKLRNQ